MGPRQPTAVPRATHANLLWYQGCSRNRGFRKPHPHRCPGGRVPPTAPACQGCVLLFTTVPAGRQAEGHPDWAFPPSWSLLHRSVTAGSLPVVISSSVTGRALRDNPRTVASQAHAPTSRPAVPWTTGDEEPLRTSEDDHCPPKLLVFPFPRRSPHKEWQVSLECSEGDWPAADSRSGNGFHMGNR